MSWDMVAAVIPYAKAIAFDGCHKIYLAMDDGEVEKFREYGYAEEPGMLLPIEDPDTALAQVRKWYAKSCSMRFVNAVRTVEGDPNKGFQTLIGQFE